MRINQRLNKIEKKLGIGEEKASYKVAKDGDIIKILNGVERKLTKEEYMKKREAEMRVGTTRYASLACYMDLESVPLLDRYEYVREEKSDIRLEDLIMTRKQT